ARDSLEHLAVVGVLALHPSLGALLVDLSALQQTIERLSAGNTPELLIVLPAKRNVLFVGESLPGPKMIFRCVGDHTIQVEEQGLNQEMRGRLLLPAASVGNMVAEDHGSTTS